MENKTLNSNNIGSTTDTSIFGNPWGNPERIQVNEVGESIEMVYKQTSMITYAVYPSRPPEERIFKIVYSCVDGKWNKSEPIFGKIIPSQNEYYEFED